MKHRDTVKNLTRGSISKALIQMSLPLIASQFVQMAYNLIDTLWVSRLGIEAVTAVSTAGLLLFLAQGICMIVQTGAQVRIGMLLGKNDLTQAQVASGTSITLNWIIMLLYVLPVLIFRHSIVGFYHIQNEVIVSYTVSYLTITIISVLFMGYNYVLLGIYTAAGDSQTPFKYNLVGMILNVILDPVLIFGLLGSPALGSDGAGYATLFSQMVVSLLYALRVHRDRHLFREGSFRSRYRMSWEECKIILCYGFPAAIQTIIFAMISSVLGKMITVYGNTYIGIQRVATQIESVAYMTANAFQVAMTSFVAQNFGAGKDKRIRDGYRVGIYLMLGLGVLTTLLFICEGRPLIKLFFTDSLAIETGTDYLQIIGYSQIFYCLEVVATGIYRGIGKPIIPAACSIIGSLLRIPMAAAFGCVTGFWWAICISTVIKGLAVPILLHFEMKKESLV